MSEKTPASFDYEKSYLTNDATNNGSFNFKRQFSEHCESTGFQVYLLPQEGKIKSITLPEKIIGYYELTFSLNDGDNITITIEAKEGKWVAKCKSPTKFRDNNGSFTNFIIYDHCYILLEHPKISCCLYAESIIEKNTQFHRYRFINNKFTIGRQPSQNNHDITCSNNLISHNHATFYSENNQWYVIDNNSLNGVYVNGVRTFKSVLHLGDRLFIMGVRIIFGIGFIAINDESSNIDINYDNLKPVKNASDIISNQYFVNKTEKKDKFFNRLPRRRQLLKVTPISLDGPPTPVSSGGLPLILRMGSGAVMAGNSLMRGNYTSILTSLLFPLLSQKYTENEKKQYESLRQKRYNEYLEARQNDIEKEKGNEEYVLQSNYPPISKVISYLSDRVQLWERRPHDDDFMNFRIGSGRIPMLAQIEYPKERFDLETDILETKMKTLAQKPVFLENVPIMLDISKHRVCSVSGSKLLQISFAKRFLLQLSILCSYDETKIIFLMEPEQLKEFNEIRYLPHTWSDQRNFRYIATNINEAVQLSEQLGKELTIPANTNDFELHNKPHYILFAFSKKLFDCVEVLSDILKDEKNTLLSVITFFDEAIKESSVLISLSENANNTVHYLTELERSAETFVMDSLPQRAFSDSMHQLSNISLKNISMAEKLPKTCTFLEIFGVGQIEQLNPLKRWEDSNPMKTLSTPIGIGTDGELMCLDLHQKYQGPHGLVAGMTGSGKSEFLISYILSMSLNYSPDEVSFLLIDYKGGGLAGAFDDPDNGIHLPHLVGTITNLDGSAVQRSLVCIESELKRRQRIFNEAKSMAGEGTMDIYLYQKLYRNGTVNQPIPHLFIISDEFAELKTQEPDFMDALISTARIGRSLGVHLILATQKPSGVVNEQIRSNTKFRVCLKVQDKADSQDMLLRPDAAELKDTGRFYLQVGYHEFFALGQSAWAGAPYEPQDTVVIKKDDELIALDGVGQPLASRKPKTVKSDSQASQLVAIVKMLSEISKQTDFVPHNLWEPPLSAKLPLNEKLLVPHSLKIPIGLLDDPEMQSQDFMYMDFSSVQNTLICGTGGCGKTTLVQTILLSLCKQCEPDEFNFYILDFSSRTFKSFDVLPHCGGVLYEEDIDKLKDFFEMIKKIVSERKKLFSDWEEDNFESASKHHKIPLILVVIDNIIAMSNTRASDAILRDIAQYMRDTATYGVKYIIACNKPGEVNSQARITINNSIALHMKDNYDYSDFLGCKVSRVPPEMPGRGIVSVAGRPLEIQMFQYRPEEDNHSRILLIKDELREIAKQCDSSFLARRLSVVDEKAEYSDFMRQFSLKRIPLGFSVDGNKSVALPLKQFCTLSLYFGKQESIIPITNNYLSAVKREKMTLWIIKRRENSLFDNPDTLDSELYSDARFFSCSDNGALEFQNALYSEFLKRMPILNQYCDEHELDSKQKNIRHLTFDYMYSKTVPLMVWVESMADLAESSNSAVRMTLSTMLDKGRKLNIYYIAGFEPDDYTRAIGCSFYGSFSDDQTIILVGGNFKNQQICTVSDSIDTSRYKYNQAIVRYNRSLHPMLIPCGEISEPEIDPDEISIF